MKFIKETIKKNNERIEQIFTQLPEKNKEPLRDDRLGSDGSTVQQFDSRQLYPRKWRYKEYR